VTISGVICQETLSSITTEQEKQDLDIKIDVYSYLDGGPGSSVYIATGYGLDGPEIKFRWGQDFPHLSRHALGPTQPSMQ